MAMVMTGEVQLAAPRDVVWAKLNDAEVLKACIPGCEELEKTSDTEFRAVAKMKVGPVSARFKGRVTLSDIDPPQAGAAGPAARQWLGQETGRRIFLQFRQSRAGLATVPCC